ncbi:MAG: hypothetical protein IPH48_05610 [bacterium]|jgi:hypothetical protein|nr:hypothetical protein [bacterium]MBK9775247.1 hypothetical protein [bacterium]
MAGDGVSLPTTLAQLGNVAKAQARATAVSQPTTPFADLAEQKGVVKAHRVQETQAQTADHKVDPDHDGLDKRQRRRQKRLGRNGEQGAGNAAAEGTEDEENASPLGNLVDLRA